MEPIPSLILVRHGLAGPEAGKAPALTPHGVLGVLQAADSLKRKGVTPLRILHSPKKRTRETAGHLADALGIPRTRLVERKDLGPDAVAEDCLMELEHDPEGTVIWVSHLPTLQVIARHLLANDAESLHFPPAGMAALGRVGSTMWRVLWTRPARQI